jgi:lipopolysaccharide export system permease protein
LERYVLRESILPFFLGFGMVTFLFLLDFLFDWLDLLLAKGVAPLVVLELFVLALGWVVALSFPCGVLVSALMTFGRLAQDNEITAMRSVGVNVARVLRAPLTAALVLTGFLILFNNYVLPESNHRFANLMMAIHRKAPAAKIEPGVFINFDDYSLMVQEVNGRTGELTDVTIYDYRGTSLPTTIRAKRGQMRYFDHGATLKLDLYDGQIHEVPGEAMEGKYRRGNFEQHTLYLRNSGAQLKRTERRSRGEREMNIQMMMEEIRQKEEQKARRIAQLDEKVRQAGFASYSEFEAATAKPSFFQRALAAVTGGGNGALLPDSTRTDPEFTKSLRVDLLDLESIERRIDSFEVEVHKKFSIPFACVVFVLVGGPLGVRTRKGGFANMAISVAFFIIYYFFLIGGEQLADRRLASPALAMWMPNIFFGLIGIYLTFSVTGWGPSRGMR